MSKNTFEIIGVGLCCGSPTVGTEYACNKLFSGYLKEHNFSYTKIHSSNRRNFKNNMYSPSQVERVTRKLFSLTNGIYNRNHTPIILGGDHSLTIGSGLSAIKKFKDDLLIVWIDAHTDINTVASSESHYIHGMTNAVLLGLQPCNIFKNGSRLANNNLAVLGARSIDDSEYTILKDNNIYFKSAEEVNSLGYEKIVKEIKSNTNATKVYISFDVDSLDPSEFISTGYNIDNGFTISNVISIIDTLRNNFELVGFECVEYNPKKDKNSVDLDKISKVIQHILI